MELIPVLTQLSALFSNSVYQQSLVLAYIGPGVGLGSLGALIGLAMGVLSAFGILCRWAFYKCASLLKHKE